MQTWLSWVLRHPSQQSPKLGKRNQTFHEWVTRCNSESSHSHFHLLILHMCFLALAEHIQELPQRVPQAFWTLSPTSTTTKPSLGPVTITSCQLLLGDGRLNNKRTVNGHSSLPYFLCSDVSSLFRSNVCKHHTVTRTFYKSLDGDTVRNTVDRKDILETMNWFQFKANNFQQKCTFPLPQSSY